MEKVSILIPMYNVEKYIGRCIESVIGQTYKNIDIVLVDDGSVDNTYQIAKGYQEKDSRIRLVTKQNQKNVSLTRNFLLDLIEGEYFVFIDSDDYVENNYIELLYDYITKNEADVAMCKYRMQVTKFPIIKKRRIEDISLDNYSAMETIVLEAFPSSFMLWNKIYKTSVLGDLRFDPHCRYGEDFNFVIHFFARAKKICFFDQALYHYMVRPGSEMRSGFGKKHVDFIRYLDEGIEVEDDENVKKILKTWAAFSSIGFVFQARAKFYKDEQDIQYMMSIAKKYESDLLADEKMNVIYKNIYQSLSYLFFGL